MSVKLRSLAVFLTLAGPSSNLIGKANEVKTQYGSAIPDQPLIAMEALQKDFSKYQGKSVVTEGKVVKVCQKKGCWMSLQNPAGDIRVTFKNYGFFVSPDLIDKSVRLVGELEQKEISESDAKHYLEDENAPKAEVDKIKGPQITWQFVASGVKIN